MHQPSSQYPAQEVHIKIDMQSVFYGEALEALSKAPCQGRSFQQIRKIKFHFFPDPEQVKACHRQREEFQEVANRLVYDEEYYELKSDYDNELEEERRITPVVNANISEFLHRIKQMTPLLREIKVTYESAHIVEHPETEFFSILLAQSFQLTSRIVHRIGKLDCPVDVPVDSISNLVHIDMVIHAIEPIAQLARQSASTLQHLRIKPHYPQCPSGLIKDTNGVHVTYPQLRVLKLHKYLQFKCSETLVFPGAIPFPNLQHLYIEGNNPFGDDVPFRGNAATLECLVMAVKEDNIVELLKRGVFTPFSHPKLQFVKLLYSYDDQSSLFESCMAYWHLLLSMAPKAVAWSLCGLGLPPVISSAISMFSDYPNIQVLDISGTDVGLWDAITLIKSLPLLSDLHSNISYRLQLPDGLKRDELPAYMLSKYAPMGPRFRCWHISESRVFATEMARYMLLLALVCPNFDYCAPPEDWFKDYMDALEMTINSGEFENHAPRLRRLLYTN